MLYNRTEGLSFERSLDLLWRETVALRCCFLLRSGAAAQAAAAVAPGRRSGSCVQRQQRRRRSQDAGEQVGGGDDGEESGGASEWESVEVDKLNGGTSGYSWREKKERRSQLVWQRDLV